MQTNKEINEKLIKQQHENIKKSGNHFLIGFFLVFMFGYLFFFTSNLWLPPSYEGIQITPIGREFTENGRSICIQRWTYCKEEKTQEIILEISNKALDADETYDWSIRDRNLGAFDIEVIVEQKDFVVLHVKKVHNRWTEVSLRMDVAGSGDFETVKMYASKKSVTKADSIRSYSENEYRKQICNEKIKAYEKEIDTRITAVAAEEEIIKNAGVHIEELKKKQTYETTEEKEKSFQDISELNNSIAAAKQEKERLQGEIREYQEKIEMQKKKRDAL